MHPLYAGYDILFSVAFFQLVKGFTTRLDDIGLYVGVGNIKDVDKSGIMLNIFQNYPSYSPNWQEEVTEGTLNV